MHSLEAAGRILFIATSERADGLWWLYATPGRLSGGQRRSLGSLVRVGSVKVTFCVSKAGEQDRDGRG
jgi:hypothetical protein